MPPARFARFATNYDLDPQHWYGYEDPATFMRRTKARIEQVIEEFDRDHPVEPAQDPSATDPS